MRSTWRKSLPVLKWKAHPHLAPRPRLAASRFPALRFHPALAYQDESSRRRFPPWSPPSPHCRPRRRALGRQPCRLRHAPRLLIAADRDAKGRRAAATLEARALARGIAATVLSPEGGDFNDDLTALGPQALAARLGHGTM